MDYEFRVMLAAWFSIIVFLFLFVQALPMILAPIIDFTEFTSANTTDNQTRTEDNFTHIAVNNSAGATIMDNLVLYMPFNRQNTTTSVYDYTVNDNDGTLTGATYNSTGGIDSTGAYEFDGTDDYVDLGDQDEMEGISYLTVCVWIKTTMDDSAGIVGKSPLDDYTWLLYKSKGTDCGAFYVTAAANSWSSSIAGSTTVHDGAWHHICGVYNASSDLKLYVDGNSEGSITGTEPATMRSGSGSVRIGRWATAHFDGSIDEVMIFNTSLTATQVWNLYNKNETIFYKGGNVTFDPQTNDGNNSVWVNASVDIPSTTGLFVRVGNFSPGVDYNYDAYQDFSSGATRHAIDPASANISVDFRLNNTNLNLTSLLKSPINFTFHDITGAGDSCSCPGSNEDWEIDHSDYCNITSDCDLGTGKLTFTGSGITKCNATIDTTSMGKPGSGGELQILDDCIIYIS